jgi:Protein of unknown function (DUF1007)
MSKGVANPRKVAKMIRSNRCWICIFIIITGLIAEAGTASAHPHVWVNATSQIVYAEDGSIKGIRHAWTFDDMSSTYAVRGINTEEKGAHTREELAPLAQLNVEPLKDFDYFTFARASGKRQDRGCHLDQRRPLSETRLADETERTFGWRAQSGNQIRSGSQQECRSHN